MSRLGVLVTCYREGALLNTAWKSLKTQTDTHFQCVIVNDDPGHAATVSACRDLERGGVRVVWHDKNYGTAAARNSGCRTLDADVIVPLDADDTLPADAIARIRRAFTEKPEADFVFGDYRLVERGNQKRVSCADLSGHGGFLDLQKISKQFSLYGGSPFRKSLWEKIGGYDAAVASGAEDLDFWLRAFTAGARGIYIPEILYHWHRSKSGCNARVSPKKWDAVYEKNKSFFLKAGEGSWQRLSFRRKVYLGEFKEARKEARRLVKGGESSRLTVLFAYLPAFFAGTAYELKRKTLGVARPF